MAAQDGSRWDTMTWKRSLETSGPDGRSIPAQGTGGETSNIWYVRARASLRVISEVHLLTGL